MTYRGQVRNGRVVLEDRVALPEGTEVDVQPVKRHQPSKRGKKKTPTLYDRLEAFVGQAAGLPPDMSVNLEHYLYGAQIV